MPRRRSLLLLIVWLCGLMPAAAQAPLALRDGDRVVFVGDGLIERAQHYGYIEAALTARWPVRSVTFRNVGWSGDTVFGEARDHYTNPPTGYEHLVEQILTPRPTVVVLGYGGTQAYEDAASLARFTEGYHQVLDTLAATGTRCVLLAPIPHEQRASPRPDVAALNAALRRTRDTIAEIATARGCGFVDLFAGMEERYRNAEAPLTTNGIHLSEQGYRHVAALIAHGLPMRPLVVDLQSRTAQDARLEAIETDGPVIRFTLVAEALPVLGDRVIAIKGLRRGRYALSAEGTVLATASAEAWAEGVVVADPAEQAQAETLRRTIIAKNQLYFRQYRPQNETYLVGFRKYEQGQNTAELGQFDPLIDDRENQIGRLRLPHARRYTLHPE